MKSQKSYRPSDLGSKNNIWTILAENMYLAISHEPRLQFSQTGTSFIKNFKMNSVKL